MCFLVDDDESGGGASSGYAKLQLRHHHKWFIPRRVLMVLFGVSLIFCIIGIIFMAIGSKVMSTSLHVVGVILFVFGIIGLITCLVVCLLAYFFYGTREQAVQTEAAWADEYLADGIGYASIGRPSALKSADSTLKRNGMPGQKKVTMAPGVGPYGESPPNTIQGVNIDARSRPQMVKSPSFGSGTVYFGEASDPRGVGGRSVSGADVGSGGIRITSLDRNQPFPSPGSQFGYGGSQVYSGSGGGQVGYGTGPGHVIYSGGGSSANSSIDATYAYPKSVSVISGQESGFNEATSGSQFSTLRSIPVTHIVSDPQRQQQDSVEYARVQKQAKTAHTLPAELPQQRGYLSQGHINTQSLGQAGQFQQSFSSADDIDYDNPIERTPMIQSKPYSHSYHEQQMQYQRQQQHQDLYTPRQVHMQSLQRQTASNPYHNQPDKQQQQQTQYYSSASSSPKVTNDDLPDLQPLVYPSARRPMTFEQVSSSKMSVYDNMLAGLQDGDE